jgi:hypothetical protein
LNFTITSFRRSNNQWNEPQRDYKTPGQPDFWTSFKALSWKEHAVIWILAIFCSDLTIAWGAQYIFSKEDLQKRMKTGFSAL